MDCVDQVIGEHANPMLTGSDIEDRDLEASISQDPSIAGPVRADAGVTVDVHCLLQKHG
jgi:hypothetical protein